MTGYLLILLKKIKKNIDSKRSILFPQKNKIIKIGKIEHSKKIYRKTELSSKKKSILKKEIVKIKKEALFSIKIQRMQVKHTITRKIRKKSLEIKKIGQPIHPYLVIQ
jgi:hypothetical protein